MASVFIIKEKINNPREWYDNEIDTNEGNIPEFNNWIEVAGYVDEEML